MEIQFLKGVNVFVESGDFNDFNAIGSSFQPGAEVEKAQKS